MENLHYFGTDGVRGIANTSLTAKIAYRIGRCLGKSKDGKKCKILLCRDTRLSGEMLKSALLSGLLASGSEVYDEGISTTPSISYLVVSERFDYGVMISASHNPFSDNGIKVFNSKGEKLEDEYEAEIERYIDGADDLPFVEGSEIGHLHEGRTLKEKYVSWLASKATASYKGLKVLVDCANGSASFVAPELYSKLGLEATFMNASPNGVNINVDCGSTHLEALKKRFLLGGYDLAFAFDGDSDRLMAIGPEGRLIDGDAQIFLNALFLQKARRLASDKVVITVMSNLGLRKTLSENGIGYEIVQVGDRNVQSELKKEGLVLGGEQSGHVIFLADLNTGDGLLSSLKLLNLYTRDKAVFAKLRELKVYPQVLKNVSFMTREALERTAASKGLAERIASAEKKLAETGRILVRPSGTEPLLRIMVECPDQLECETIVDDIVAFAQKEAS
jgi:phosphoglucosamine mutase